MLCRKKTEIDHTRRLQRTTEEESISNDSDTTALKDCIHNESAEEFSDDDLTSLAVVKFPSRAKSQIYYHNELLKKVSEDELEAKFLKRGRACPTLDKPTFTFNHWTKEPFQERMSCKGCQDQSLLAQIHRKSGAFPRTVEKCSVE